MDNIGFLPKASSIIYKNLIKKIFFRIDPETVHTVIVRLGEKLGNNKKLKNLLSSQFKIENKALRQTIAGIEFENPIGLAAGFDYEARLTQILPCLGFGFETVGTITNLQCIGNPKPRLGRLPKSNSLMVNKGFRNPGTQSIIKKLSRFSFDTPLGISIGKTNTLEINSLKKSIADIANAFIAFEKSKLNHSYYELNISCPNMSVNVDFYAVDNLKQLLHEIDMLNLKKSLFIKMPIDKNNQQALGMLLEISKHQVHGVIFGNLQKDRKNKMLNQQEASKFKVGNFSGKPTYERSNELIKLAYENFKERFIIIGCGGVFNAKDAYTKIKFGASLVQLITGMIFEGPQLATQINNELIELLKKDGFKNVSEAIGVDIV